MKKILKMVISHLPSFGNMGGVLWTRSKATKPEGQNPQSPFIPYALGHPQS